MPIHRPLIEKNRPRPVAILPLLQIPQGVIKPANQAIAVHRKNPLARQHVGNLPTLPYAPAAMKGRPNTGATIPHRPGTDKAAPSQPRANRKSNSPIGTFSISDGLTRLRHEQPGLPATKSVPLRTAKSPFLSPSPSPLYLRCARQLYPAGTSIQSAAQNPCKGIYFTGIFHMQVI